MKSFLVSLMCNKAALDKKQPKWIKGEAILSLSRRSGDTYTTTNSKGSLFKGRLFVHTPGIAAKSNYKQPAVYAFRLKRLFEN